MATAAGVPPRPSAGRVPGFTICQEKCAHQKCNRIHVHTFTHSADTDVAVSGCFSATLQPRVFGVSGYTATRNLQPDQLYPDQLHTFTHFQKLQPDQPPDQCATGSTCNRINLQPDQPATGSTCIRINTGESGLSQHQTFGAVRYRTELAMSGQ